MRRPTRFDDAGRMQAAINITPLVDVVLVLLIIFMVMVPQMGKGPDVDLPDTAKPTQQGDEKSRIMVTIDDAGRLWINDLPFGAEQFGDGLRAAAAARPEASVVIRGDAKLNFREVRQTMLAIEQAGFHGVGLIAQRAGAGAGSGAQENKFMQLDTGDRSSLQAEINITPLVDVVLVLLIIFMVVVPLMMEGYDVDIPRTSTAAVPTQAEDSQLILSIVPNACPLLGPPSGEGLPTDCRVTLADQKIPASELPQRVANILGARPPEKRVLFLSADDRLNYEGVLRILDLAKSNVEGLKIEFLTAQ